MDQCRVGFIGLAENYFRKPIDSFSVWAQYTCVRQLSQTQTQTGVTVMATATANNVRYVYANGPHWEVDAQDREVEFWLVGVCLDDDFVGRFYRCCTKSRAQNLAEQMSRDRGLPLELDLG